MKTNNDSKNTPGPRALYLVAGLMLAACGAPEVKIGAECWGADGRTHVWVEAGHPLIAAYGADKACAGLAMVASTQRALYESGWGPLSALESEGWVLVFLARETAQPGHSSVTYGMVSREIQIGNGAWWSIPHELHHVRMGTASIGHDGWACDFGPWEQSVGLSTTPDEDGYLPRCRQ